MGKFEAPYEWNGESQKRINTGFWKRPLLASDWSEPSNRALDAALSLKGVVEKIIVTHVLGARQTKNLEPDAIRNLEKVSLERLKAYSQRVDDAGIKAEHHLAMGRTVEEIIKMSRNYDATMIVLGRTGKDWFHQYWLGGVSHKIAELSELPVLLIP
jgi:nucleotide-binding universal stress UspA family protein